MDWKWTILHRDYGRDGQVFVSLRGRLPAADGSVGEFYRRLAEETSAHCERIAQERWADYERDPDPKKRYRLRPVYVRIRTEEEPSAVVRRVQILHGAHTLCDETFRDEFENVGSRILLSK